MRCKVAGILAVILLSSALGLASDSATSREVAVSGNTVACAEFEKLVVQPAGFDAVSFAGIPVPVTDFPKFRAIVFAERDETAMRGGSKWTPEDFQAVESYVRAGGIIVFCRYGISTVLADRALGEWGKLAGFSSWPDAKDPGNVELTSAFHKWIARALSKEPVPTETNWVAGSVLFAEGLTSAEELAVISVNSGSMVRPFITVNRIGAGCVYFLGTSLDALTRRQVAPASTNGLAMTLRATLTAAR
jgi:hypothetical protein